jgi:hypothetical protein
MNNIINIKTSPEVEKLISSYPENVRKKLFNLRSLILETAEEIDGIEEIEESLKWGEPSYKTNIGSPIRFDWKEKSPEQYALYFNCQSKLVPTFRLVHGDTLDFEGDRAIILQLDDEIPETEIKECLAAALTYHEVKHKEMLGL